MTDIVKQPLEKPTIEQSFKPSANQEKWLDTAIQMETDEITSISLACGIDRTIWYDWLKKPGFIEWFNKTWDDRLRGHAWKLDAIGLKNSKRDFNYWKAMQQRAGRSVENNGNVNVQVNVTPILGGATKGK